jgi:hypothetical protein
MNDRNIGIDTMGYDHAPEAPEITPDEEERQEELESQIDDLVSEYEKIGFGKPSISGYTEDKVRFGWERSLRHEIAVLKAKVAELEAK